MERGIFLDQRTAERMTVAELLAQYQEKITPRKKAQKQERSRIKILTSLFGPYALAKLTPEIVIDAVDDRLETVSADTVRKELGTLSHAVDTGMALWDVRLPANPVHTARRILSVTKTLSPGQHRERRPTKEELELLLDSDVADLVIWLIETGMRRGEVAAAKRRHRKGNTFAIPDTKTDRSRTIPLSPEAIAVFERQPERFDGSLFGLKADSITQKFSRACEALGIEDLRLHDLRHEATSRLFEKGLGIQEVASITGHTDYKSLKRYTHPQAEELAKKLRA